MLFSELPEKCPKCERSFYRLLQRPRWSKKAVLVFLLGNVFTVVWIGFLAYAMFVEGIIAVPKGGGFAGLLAVYFGPGMLAGYIAMRMRRVVPMSCRKCGWSEVFIIDNAR